MNFRYVIFDNDQRQICGVHSVQQGRDVAEAMHRIHPKRHFIVCERHRNKYVQWHRTDQKDSENAMTAAAAQRIVDPGPEVRT